MGSPDGLKAKSGRKRGAGDAAGPNNAVRMKKRVAGGLVGETAGDALKQQQKIQSSTGYTKDGFKNQ
jgi:hypothetical protein